LNILVLEKAEVGAPIPRTDRRWSHVKKVLKKKPGDRLDAGIVDGELGKALVLALTDKELVLGFEPEREAPPLAPIRLILGFPRPIQAARILKDLTSLGVAEIRLTGTELGEKSYAQSSIFKDKDFRGPLLEGAEQAGNPRLPKVFTHWNLAACLAATGVQTPGSETIGGLTPAECRGSRIFLHPYGEAERMGRGTGIDAPLTLAIGSERGWTEAEIELFRASGFSARSLGDRILKTETAALAATVLALAAFNLL
jgi:16S rRNA (uracil1498-N3)-methyltransferase